MLVIHTLRRNAKVCPENSNFIWFSKFLGLRQKIAGMAISSSHVSSCLYKKYKCPVEEINLSMPTLRKGFDIYEHITIIVLLLNFYYIAENNIKFEFCRHV